MHSNWGRETTHAGTGAFAGTGHTFPELVPSPGPADKSCLELAPSPELGSHSWNSCLHRDQEGAGGFGPGLRPTTERLGL